MVFPQYRQGETVRLADDPAVFDYCDRGAAGSVGKIEGMTFDHYWRQWVYLVRIPGGLVLTTGDGLKTVADDLGA